MQTTHRKIFIFSFFFPIAAFFAAFLALPSAASLVSAETVDELRQKISENNKKIENLQNQIEQYSNLLDSTSKEAKTLKSALSALELTQKKLEISLSLTTAQISKTKLTLAELNDDITLAERKIEKDLSAIGENIRAANMTESQSVVEELLGGKKLSDTWNYINALRTIQSRVEIDLENLRDLRATLQAKIVHAPRVRVDQRAYVVFQLAQVLGWVLISRAVDQVPAAQLSLVLLLQPVFAYLWDMAFFARGSRTVLTR